MGCREGDEAQVSPHLQTLDFAQDAAGFEFRAKLISGRASLREVAALGTQLERARDCLHDEQSEAPQPTLDLLSAYHPASGTPTSNMVTRWNV